MRVLVVEDEALPAGGLVVTVPLPAAPAATRNLLWPRTGLSGRLSAGRRAVAANPHQFALRRSRPAAGENERW